MFWKLLIYTALSRLYDLDAPALQARIAHKKLSICLSASKKKKKNEDWPYPQKYHLSSTNQFIFPRLSILLVNNTGLIPLNECYRKCSDKFNVELLINIIVPTGLEKKLISIPI
jgi:hypothetical protein